MHLRHGILYYITQYSRHTALDRTLNCPREEKMRRGGKSSHINSLGFRDYSRIRNDLHLYRSKIVGSSCAEDPYIKKRLLKKPKIKRAVGRGCEVTEDQAFSQEVLMRTGNYVHSFLYSLHESGGHNSTCGISACIFAIQIYILITWGGGVLDKTLKSL